MSVNRKGHWAVVDAGMKAVSLDSGPPIVHSNISQPLTKLPPLTFVNGGDEHGKLILDSSHDSKYLPSLGEKLLLIPGHCDPTVNLYDTIVAVRNNVVEMEWKIEARGPGL